MQKIELNKPLLVLLYGYPGSGKTYFSNQLCDAIGAAHLHDDKVRSELFKKPKFDDNENEIIDHIMRYMTQEFLRTGVSVVYDMNAAKTAQRRELREIASKSKAKSVLIWLQIDTDSAMARLKTRDMRKADDKLAKHHTKQSFEAVAGAMQNPGHEDYMVISGKHTFNSQKSAVFKKLYDLGVINNQSASSNVVKPGMINLVPKPSAGRVDMSRRNITIR